LGVRQNIVEEDYLLSAKFTEKRKTLIWMLRLSRGKEAAETVQTFFQVQKEWIKAAFQAIDTRWGNFETYSYDALGLTASQISQLKDQLLEGPTNK
jgi:protein tyrosine/serine phosphatase